MNSARHPFRSSNRLIDAIYDMIWTTNDKRRRRWNSMRQQLHVRWVILSWFVCVCAENVSSSKDHLIPYERTTQNVYYTPDIVALRWAIICMRFVISRCMESVLLADSFIAPVYRVKSAISVDILWKAE